MSGSIAFYYQNKKEVYNIRQMDKILQRWIELN